MGKNYKNPIRNGIGPYCHDDISVSKGGWGVGVEKEERGLGSGKRGLYAAVRSAYNSLRPTKKPQCSLFVFTPKKDPQFPVRFQRYKDHIKVTYKFADTKVTDMKIADI